MRIIRLYFFLLFCITGGYSAACYGAGVTVYFYNPETNINNFTSLKTEFDSYFSTRGNYQLQPFNEQEIFEKSLGKKGSIYLLSNWHFNVLQQKFPLQIALLGTLKGNPVQKKILSATKEIVDFSMLKNATIAGAGSEQYIRSVLQQINPERYKELSATLKILKVPKDIDALMSVGFGMADAAIAAESNLKTLESLNVNQYKQLHSLGESENSYLLVAATFGKPDKEETKVLEILFNMTGQNNLNLLGLDGWIWK